MGTQMMGSQKMKKSHFRVHHIFKRIPVHLHTPMGLLRSNAYALTQNVLQFTSFNFTKYVSC